MCVGRLVADANCCLVQLILLTLASNGYMPSRIYLSLVDGYTYERSAITDWLSKGRRTSPVTNLPLPTTLLIPNRLVKTLIEKQNKS